jgi:prepilin-type N-terminal cleavage/methylation domain-containing protein
LDVTKIHTRRTAAMRGFSLLEWSIALIILAVLLGVIGLRVMELQAGAEQAGVKNLVATLNSALGMRVATYQARQDRRGLAALAGSNPMDNLERVPPGYRGELRDATLAGPGDWYFDRASGTLVYRVRNVERLRDGLAPSARLRFTIRLVYQDVDHNGRYDRDRDNIQGARLVALDADPWTH